MAQNNDYMDFSFDAGDDGLGKKGKAFKGKEGENYRLSFVWWPMVGGKPAFDAKLPNDDEKFAGPRFVGVKRHYIAGAGYVVSKGPAYDQLAGGPPKTAIATIICAWPTDSKGNLDKDKFLRGEVSVMPWIFSGDKYESLKRRHGEFPFGSHDIAVACTDSQFQKMDISPCKESLFRKCYETDKLRPIADGILASVSQIETTVQSDLARVLTIEQIREKIAGGGGGAGGGARPGAGASGVSASDVDNLLDNLLE